MIICWACWEGTLSGEGVVGSLSEHCFTVLHALYMGFSGTKNNLKPLNLFVHYFLQIFNQLFKSTIKSMSSSKAYPVIVYRSNEIELEFICTSFSFLAFIYTCTKYKICVAYLYKQVCLFL